MLTEILEQAEGVKTSLEEQIDGFDYSVISATCYTGRDGDYIAIKTEIQNQYNVLQIELSNLYKALEDVEDPPELRDMPTKRQIALSMAKYVLFGGCVGLVLMTAFFYFLFFTNGKLHSAEELSHYSGTDAIAYESLDRKRKTQFLYRVIAQKESKHLLYTGKEALTRALSNVQKLTPDCHKVMITGIDTDSELSCIKSSIKDVALNGLEIGVERNILADINSFKRIKDYDVIILVESIDRTDVSLITKEVEQMKISGKPIVGALLVR